MRCRICGTECGRYHLCKECNQKKDAGIITRCKQCGSYHYTSIECDCNGKAPTPQSFTYNLKSPLISKSEQNYYYAILEVLPLGYCVFPQVNLAAFIEKNQKSGYQTELFRNVDFLVTDANYNPKIAIEINDQSHNDTDRQKRDKKVTEICEEAGIPLIKLWTSYGVRKDYISEKIKKALTDPIVRISHTAPKDREDDDTDESLLSKFGCYIATCVYGSYDCPQVWTLRRYRDITLASTWYGRAFIKVYYAISPRLVKWFGKTAWFKNLFKKRLDRLVQKLSARGFSNEPYEDK